jgi:pyruvate formate-lyase activating enzyme-like uncharacterized protein
MIRIYPIQEAYKQKIERQENLRGLKFKCHGSCAFVGEDVSPGCYGCFYPDAYHHGFILGKDLGLPNVCNRDCVYCFEPHTVSQNPVIPEGFKMGEGWRDIMAANLEEEKQKISTDCKMQYYEFTGICEPLLYLPVIEELMGFYRSIVDPFMGTKGWAKVYTNGTLLDLDNILRLKDVGFDEVRVHLGATHFSGEVYDNLRQAVKFIPVVTIETPAWPPHRNKLFEMLPIIHEIGVKHLNICQIEITHKKQLDNIEKALGTINLYQAFYPVLDDNGLVEEIMNEVLIRNYSFSVLDCNGFVKQSRSAISNQSYWSILNRKYPAEWEKQRYQRSFREKSE